MKHVKFLQDKAVSPNGHDTKAFEKGAVAELPDALADDLVASKIAEEADAPKPAKKSAGAAPENK